MAFNLFGFAFGGPNKKKTHESFAPPENNDGALIVDQGGTHSTVVDLDGVVKTEAELIGKYRDCARLPEVDAAVSEIVNEAIVSEENKSPVSLVTDKLNYRDDVIAKIQAEFDNILGLLDFNNEGQDIFRSWYIDGRLFYHIIIDEKNPRNGIQELRFIDPRKIKPVIETETRINDLGFPVNVEVSRYYMYNPYTVDVNMAGSVPGSKIAWDSVCYCHSGLHESNNTMVISHLHKAMKSSNMLTMTEDATVIYRLSRAPDRRVFYIDVGNLPKQKAEQYLKDIMAKYRNKMVYDASTGEIREDKKFLSFMEDYWLPRREGNRGTEIQTLPGGENLGEMADVEYFREKLYRSLNVPVGRLKPDSGMSIGRATEITREEVKFSKFIDRLRNRFSHLFDTLLSTQLMLKGIVAREDWRVIRQKIFYDYLRDTYFAEMKDLEILRERLSSVDTAVNYVGKYYSHEWVRRTILRQTDEDIKRLDDQMTEEKDNPRYQAVEALTGMLDPAMMGMGGGMPGVGGPPGGGTPMLPPASDSGDEDEEQDVESPYVNGEEPEPEEDEASSPDEDEEDDDEEQGPAMDADNLPSDSVTKHIEALWKR
jgi:hypothetical protein